MVGSYFIQTSHFVYPDFSGCASVCLVDVSNALSCCLAGACRATKKSRGIGYVQFAKAEDAGNAMAGMDGSIFQGRLLHVLPARKAPVPLEQPDKVPRFLPHPLSSFVALPATPAHYSKTQETVDLHDTYHTTFLWGMVHVCTLGEQSCCSQLLMHVWCLTSGLWDSQQVSHGVLAGQSSVNQLHSHVLVMHD